MDIKAAIFDVDGVLVASPHEQAWREALEGFGDQSGFTTAFYQANVAGRPRMEGAKITLDMLGGPGAASRIDEYAQKKQAIVDRLIANGEFEAFPDAVRFADALHAAGVRLALASSSKNADAMLSQLNLADGRGLLSIFSADLSGRDVPRGKPDPALFLMASREVGMSPETCLVVEDAPAGIRAARAGGMYSVGIARLGDQALLEEAGAGLVVTSLDRVDVAALVTGNLRAEPAGSMEDALQATPEPGWVLRHHGYSVQTESIVESRFALGNGFLGLRAARAVSRGPTWASWLGYLRWASWPRCYVAGLFDIPNMEPPVPALVPVADWTRIRILLDGQVLLGREGELLSGLRQLDMRRGILISSWNHRTPEGVLISGQEARLVSQADRASALQVLRLAVDRDGLDLEMEASFSLSGLGMEPLWLEQGLGAWRTEVTDKSVAMAGEASLTADGEKLQPIYRFPLRWTWRWRSIAGQALEFVRHVGVGRGDSGEDDPIPAARSALKRGETIGWRPALGAHEAAWRARWDAGDVVVEGDDEIQRAARFAAYHLISAANPQDESVSIGARALTGDAYFGHVFWDTEIYLLPFYTATWPEAARALLMYRFHTLPAARAKAARISCRGALYAWESADTGAETTPEHVVGPDGAVLDILCGKLEQHVSADIAYAVWQYWRAAEDDDFFLTAGAEIMLETARFWASRAAPEADGKRHIRHVIGPDEYHEDVDDSAFTNSMARWNIERGLETVEVLKARWPKCAAALADRLELGEAELDDWRDAAARLVSGLDPATGLYEEFAGFHDLEPLDLKAYPGRKVPIDVIIGRERTQKSQVVKQADVVALLALLPELFPGESAMRNFRHYEPRCGHGSSLSPAMHALVAARLGDVDMALSYLHAIAELDDNPTVAGGVRIAGLGGIWQAVVLGFGGLDLSGEILAIEPKMPPRWRGLAYRACWKGRSVAVDIRDGKVRATLETGAPIDIRIAGTTRRLEPGAPVEAPLAHAEPALVRA
jgi:HAD superfamily hydrolase (TIGR01509 family)